MKPRASVVLRWLPLAYPILLAACVESAPQNAPVDATLVAKGDRSGPRPMPGSSWDTCPFPWMANIARVDEATVDLRVTVAPTGVADAITVVHDPGYAFAQAAGTCAFAQRYVPAHDADGRAVRGEMTLRVHFSRPPPASWAR
jgi:hypothetical protein